jgi:hypothetical protein
MCVCVNSLTCALQAALIDTHGPTATTHSHWPPLPPLTATGHHCCHRPLITAATHSPPSTRRYSPPPPSTRALSHSHTRTHSVIALAPHRSAQRVMLRRHPRSGVDSVATCSTGSGCSADRAVDVCVANTHLHWAEDPLGVSQASDAEIRAKQLEGAVSTPPPRSVGRSVGTM